MRAVILEFGEFHLDCDRFELRRSKVPLRLERKPLELLILLASSGGRLVTRDEIARCLWPSDVFVDTEHGINTAIRKIRHALRENPGRPRFLETVTGKGYRFTGVKALPQPAPSQQNDPLQPSGSDALRSEPMPVTPPPEPIAPPGFGNVRFVRQPVGWSAQFLWLTASVLAVSLAIGATIWVRARVQPHISAPLVPADAVEAYQHGRFLWFSNHQETSGAYFLKATQIAPQYAPAWAGLAIYYGAQIAKGVLDPGENLSLQDAAAHRAAQLDDNLAESHLALGGSDWGLNWDFPSALKELDRAIQLDPKFTEAHHLRAKLLGQLNQHDEAVAEQRLAMQLNPFERPWALGYTLLLARRYDAAIAEIESRLEGATNSRLWCVLSEAYAAKGMQNASEDAREQCLTLAGDRPAAQATHRAFLHGGRREVLLSTLSKLKSESQSHYVSPYKIAAVYAELGQKQQALDALEETVRQHSPTVFDLQNDFSFDGLHADPRYRAIVQRIGLRPAW